jgi:hypothetical protein
LRPAHSFRPGYSTQLRPAFVAGFSLRDALRFSYSPDPATRYGEIIGDGVTLCVLALLLFTIWPH